ncbi:MAG: alpha/beta hydrolase [Leptospira sp.]|nr:alpha/beta hydrolase [Leptospira sp.]
MQDYEIIFNGYHAKSKAFDPSIPPKLLIIIWPSTGGNARAYRIKDSELEQRKICLLRYNPTSHGNSIGNYNIPSSIEDLKNILKENDLLEVPIIGIGHSGGGAALVEFSQQIVFSKLYLLSPILDSRLSLHFMYEKKNISEFLTLLYPDSVKESNPESYHEKVRLIHSKLDTDEWLSKEHLNELDFPIYNSRIRVTSLAEFLRNLFIPGFTIYERIKTNSENIKIFLPDADNWYPISHTLEVIHQYNIDFEIITNAKDHFFTNSWLMIWNKINKEIKMNFI